MDDVAQSPAMGPCVLYIWYITSLWSYSRAGGYGNERGIRGDMERKRGEGQLKEERQTTAKGKKTANEQLYNNRART